MKIIIPFVLFFFSYQLLFTQQNVLEQLLIAHPQYFQHITDSLDKYQVQIVFSQINRDKNNHPTLMTHQYNVDESKYFYPASTVKMPTAFMAMEKLNDLNILGLDKYTNMQTGIGHLPQTRVSVDTSANGLIPSVANYVKKIFIVSDNDAQNRLYEFVGQADLNHGLRAKGLDKLRIVHRLGVGGFDVEANQYTNPVSFYGQNELLYHQGEVKSNGYKDWQLTESIRGVAYMNTAGEIVDAPFDFTKKNFISVPVLHNLLQTVVLPNSVPPQNRFRFTEEDYQFLYQVMSELPQESEYPNYGKKADNYCKFYLYGEEGEDFKIPDHIRIFNKVGWAYGFLSDVSYIVDFDNKVEFLVAAVIHVNANQTYNDGVYEYESIGLPFFAKLGQVLYEHELKREKAFLPDLSRYRIEKYD